MTMSVEQYCTWWAANKDSGSSSSSSGGSGGGCGQLLYLKDWHLAHEHPEFEVGGTGVPGTSGMCLGRGGVQVL